MAAEKWLAERQTELVAESNRQIFAVMRDAAEQIALAKRAAASQAQSTNGGPPAASVAADNGESDLSTNLTLRREAEHVVAELAAAKQQLAVERLQAAEQAARHRAAAAEQPPPGSHPTHLLASYLHFPASTRPQHSMQPILPLQLQCFLRRALVAAGGSWPCHSQERRCGQSRRRPRASWRLSGPRQPSRCRLQQACTRAQRAHATTGNGGVSQTNWSTNSSMHMALNTYNAKRPRQPRRC